LRIISGILKGKKLTSFQGDTIRPTSDRIREAVFNILAPRIQGSVVLDLFAGTGALGIEALSRGASAATFIEKDTAALSLLRRNLKLCGFETLSTVIQWDILKSLQCLQPQDPKFDLVFMDPPYRKDLIQNTLRHLHMSRVLQKNALVVAEHSQFDSIQESPAAFKAKDERRYRKTLVSFLEYMV
jgi:16S rRNA (guanine966-N2)-methyltransferase